jgi:hypothetical protein
MPDVQAKLLPASTACGIISNCATKAEPEKIGGDSGYRGTRLSGPGHQVIKISGGVTQDKALYPDGLIC